MNGSECFGQAKTVKARRRRAALCRSRLQRSGIRVRRGVPRHWRRECSARGWGCARWHAASRHGVCGARLARGRHWVFGLRGVEAAGAAGGAALPRARVLRRPGDLVGVCTPGDANIAFRLSTGTWIRREVEPGGGHVQCRLFSIPCFRLFHGIYSQGFDGFLA